MFDLIVPVLGMAIPVLVVVSLAVLFGRKLSGSCGGVGADGKCSRCGKPEAEMPGPATGGGRSCP